MFIMRIGKDASTAGNGQKSGGRKSQVFDIGLHKFVMCSPEPFIGTNSIPTSLPRALQSNGKGAFLRICCMACSGLDKSSSGNYNLISGDNRDNQCGCHRNSEIRVSCPCACRDVLGCQSSMESRLCFGEADMIVGC